MNQSEIELEKVKTLFDDTTFTNGVTDIYKSIHIVFKDIYLKYDKVEIDMHNSMIGPLLLEYFQEAYLNGRCELPENLILLKNWINNFAHRARQQKINQENYLFLSAGIVFGITNMIREFREVKNHRF